MSPKIKESAYLHLPTYLAGIVYHIGTFLAIFLFILSLFNIWLSGWMMWIAAAVMLTAGISGLAILIKRISKHELRSLSNPDDYISNVLVTAFQFIGSVALFEPAYLPVYFIVASLLLLYFPMGKLKHAVYFFAARYHLGFFYGWRNVWPPKPVKK
jgi:nitrate reductase gamma subunit